MHRLLRFLLAILLAAAAAHQAGAQTAGGTYYDLGVFAYEEGKFQEAETHFKKALETEPENPSIHHYLGKTYMEQERFAEADQHLKAAWKKDPDLPGLAYDRAFVHYKMGQYGPAADLFLAVVKDDPQHIMANFYGGVSLYKKERYKEADGYLMTASQMGPELKIKANYYSGLCHYYLGQEQEAVQKLTYVQTNAESSEVRNNAGQWLNRIREGKKIRKPYAVEVKLGVVYDDNVPLDSSDLDNFSASDQSDTAVLGYAAGRYSFINRRDMEVGLGLSRSQSWYSDLDEYNSSETTGQLYGYYYADPFSFGLNLRPVVYQVDGEDFLLILQAIPQVTYRLSRSTLLRAFYTYSGNDYRKDAYDERDGATHEIYLDVMVDFKENRGFAVAGMGYEDNAAEEDIYDFGRINVKLAVEYETVWDLRLKLIGKYFNKSYKEDDPLEGDKRQDNQFQGSVSLSRKLWVDWLRLAVEYDYTSNASNIDEFTYTRQLFGAILIAEF